MLVWQATRLLGRATAGEPIDAPIDVQAVQALTGPDRHTFQAINIQANGRPWTFTVPIIDTPELFGHRDHTSGLIDDWNCTYRTALRDLTGRLHAINTRLGFEALQSSGNQSVRAR